MQINGEIHSIGQEQQVSDNFKKREFVLITEQSTQYPQFIPMEFNQDKCSLLNSYNEGDKVSVDFNMRGRQHNGNSGLRTYLTLQAWKIERV